MPRRMKISCPGGIKIRTIFQHFQSSQGISCYPGKFNKVRACLQYWWQCGHSKTFQAWAWYNWTISKFTWKCFLYYGILVTVVSVPNYNTYQSYVVTFIGSAESSCPPREPSDRSEPGMVSSLHCSKSFVSWPDYSAQWRSSL